LQNLTIYANPGAKGSPKSMPSMMGGAHLSVEELDKRIQELKTVQFWLEQNANALKATIQALEVQKMTLSTLQGMNVNMQDLAKAFTAKVPDLNKAPEAEKPSEPAVDPMQWWGSLTQQFQNIAAAAILKDVAANAMKDKTKAARKHKSTSSNTHFAARKTAQPAGKPAA
jgi:hypothetical protein